MPPRTAYTPSAFNPNGLLPSRLYPGLAVAAVVTGAVVPAMFGMGIYSNPQIALNSLSIRIPENEADRKKIHSVFKLSAAREMAFGVTAFGIWWYSARKGNWPGYWSLGVAMLAKATMKFLDGSVIESLNGYGKWTHWGFVLPDALAGLMLLGVI